MALKFIYHEYLQTISCEKQSRYFNLPLSKLSDLTSLKSRVWECCRCYYSGKIEGNTCACVETEALLKDGITSEKRYEDAKMLKNLHNLFVSEMEYIHKGKNTEIIDERTLLRLHFGLSSGLVSDEEAGLLPHTSGKNIRN